MAKPKDVFTVQRDGKVFRWYRYHWPCGILSSKESFATVDAATEAALVVAQCEGALFTPAARTVPADWPTPDEVDAIMGSTYGYA